MQTAGTITSTASAQPKPGTDCWHLVTCEYPPQLGGVSDYSYLLARELASTGDAVHVWCPGVGKATPQAVGVTVHRRPKRFGIRDLFRIDGELNRFHGPRRILVQWVPHGYGYQSMNVGFCIWLWKRAKFHRDHVEVMVHEPHLGFYEGSWKQNVAAAIHRLMDVIWLGACEKVWISIPFWERELKPFAMRRDLPFCWLPIPSNMPAEENAASIAYIRLRYAGMGQQLIGHFGTNNPLVLGTLKTTLLAVLERNSHAVVLLIGAGSTAFRQEILANKREWDSRIHATGPMNPEQVSAHLAACDVVVQPYRDGVSTRRGSVMAALANGCAIVTTHGLVSEDIWAESGAVKMAPAGDDETLIESVEQVLTDDGLRGKLRAAAKELYRTRFDISHTTEKLRAARAAAK